jgi:hypothetical protein
VAGLAKGRDLLRTLGHTSTKLVSLTETTLDDHYAMARTEFVWRFSNGLEPVDVDVHSTFILHIHDGVVRIVFQQEHEDFQQLLRARGLLPPKPPLTSTGGSH